MINVKRASESIGRLARLKFFPASDIDRTEILKLICEMASTNEQIDWLVNRVRALWTEWEGELELRAVLCSKYRPADGIEAYSRLKQFQSGIPAESESAPQLQRAEIKKLEAGPIGNSEMRALIESAKPAKNLNAVRGLSIKTGIILPCETEDGALERTLTEEREKREQREQAKRPYAASEAQIADVKRRQLEAAQSLETKAILTEEARGAKRRALDDAAKAAQAEISPGVFGCGLCGDTKLILGPFGESQMPCPCTEMPVEVKA